MFITMRTVCSLVIFILCTWSYGHSGSANEKIMGRKLCPPMANVPQPVNRVNTSKILEQLRYEMKRINAFHGSPIDGYIIPDTDEHQNEEVADHDKRLKYISGFSGLGGVALVTQTKAIFWTVWMYHQQADEELSCDWQLLVHGESLRLDEWILDEFKPNSRIGADLKLISNGDWEFMYRTLANASINLVPINNNLIDLIWVDNRPNYPAHEAFVWPLEYAGKKWDTKVDDTREKLVAMGFDAMIVTALDEIAWLLNIRGHDIPYGPFLKSYVIISKDQLHLYADLSKLSSDVRKHLRTENCYSAHCVRLHDYDAVWTDLRSFSQVWRKVLVPSATEFNNGASRCIFILISAEKRKQGPSPIMYMMAEKNPVEKIGMRLSHIRDSAAMCNILAKLNEQFNNGHQLTELAVATMVDTYRQAQNYSRGASFKSIVGYGPNGAIPHYTPSTASSLKLDHMSTLVIDSGAHYWDGTTDVTRTVHFGQPSAEQIDAYTRVLMASIDLASFTFPHSLRVNQIDVVARAPLWDTGYDYKHGTSHGIGVFLKVHEPPVNMYYGQKSTDVVLKEGYFISDEPGYYKENHFGVRLETILEVIAKNETMGKFLTFTPITLVPFEPKLINYSMLSPKQIRWLNEYNAKIRLEVGAELLKQADHQLGYGWMMDRTVQVSSSSRSIANSFCFVVLVAQIISVIGQ
ncbi:xaa-Pro aminopeptidase ApepP-like [Adelges cooleyi]|uniref:xaa-Pro aminopeptidase ApepP-like n=1 Tax=Adelges cooleyi TaxID=133065 RepID=UPI00217FF590|nr:xaa-Pro aminopeptidase ApepP-like [Adelges cooleyi]